MNAKLSYFDYVKAAFGQKFRVPLLGYLPINILMLSGFGILGLGHPAFWLLGLAYEAGYLIFFAGSRRFQTLIDGERLLAWKNSWQARQVRILGELDQTARQRYGTILTLSEEIMKSSQSQGAPVGYLHEQSLSQLQWTYLQLLTSRQRIRSTLAEVKPSQLEKEMAGISTQMKSEDPASPLYRSLQGTLDIAQRRLENYHKAEEHQRVLDAELLRIEKQCALLREEAAIAGSADLITAKLDGVISSLQQTSRFLSDNQAFFGSIEEDTLQPPPPIPQTFNQE